MKVVKTRLAEQDVFANLRDWAPEDLLSFLDQVVLLLPEDVRFRLKQVIDSLSPEGDNMHKVLELVRSQWRGIQSDQWIQIAVAGSAQTGKNSLINAIASRQDPEADSIFTIVDIQGLDEYLGYKADRTWLGKFDFAEVILLVLDAQYEVSDSTLSMYQRLSSLDKPVLVILNKMDLVERPWKALRKAGRQLGTTVLSFSSMQPETIDKLLKSIVEANPRTFASFTGNFPEFRRTICNGIISQAAFAGAVVGAVPIPVSDLLPITAIQTGMLLKIARAFGYHLNRQRARELIPMLLTGLAVREGSHWLRARYPHYRSLISVSVAGVWTFCLGQAAVQYFEKCSTLFNQAESSLLSSVSAGSPIE
jgi:GTP-binding protein Era